MNLSVVDVGLNRKVLFLLKKSGHLSILPVFFTLLRRSLDLPSIINTGTYYKSRCPFSGYSRGLRYNVSRLQLLRYSYRALGGSFFGGRW